MLFLPSLFFIVVLVEYATSSGAFYPIRYIVAGVFCLPLIVNLFIQDIIFSRIIGTAILLLILYSDVINGKAIPNHLLPFFYFLICIAMSVLLIIGYKKEYKRY